MNQPVQLLGGIFSAYLLNQPDDAADQNHRKNNNGRRLIARKIRGQDNIRHQRNDAQNKEYHREGIDKSPTQTAYQRIPLSLFKKIGAVRFPHRIDTMNIEPFRRRP